MPKQFNKKFDRQDFYQIIKIILIGIAVVLAFKFIISNP